MLRSLLLRLPQIIKLQNKKQPKKIKARKAAKEAYDKAVADSTTQVNTQLDIAAYKSEPINEGLRTLFSSSNDFTSLDGYTVSTGVLDYLKLFSIRKLSTMPI